MKLDERIDEALKRISRGDAPMRIPADPTDPDLVLVDCRDEIRRLRARVAAAQRILLPMEDCDPDIREWLGLPRWGTANHSTADTTEVPRDGR